MKVKLSYLSALLGCGLFWASCSDDKVAVSQVSVDVVISNPLGNEIQVKDGTYTFSNVSTGEQKTIPYGASLSRSISLAEVVDGLYNVSFEGVAEYTYLETESDSEGNISEVTKSAEVKIQGSQQNVEVKGGSTSLNLTVYVIRESNEDLVFYEIFPTGTLNPETNKQYNGDQYVILHNNSSETVYADGLIFAESEFSTVLKNDYNPNIIDEAFTAQVIAVIPGSGTDYPVLPGSDIVICDNAMNHKEANPVSCDLSNANFEWFTNSTSTSVVDADNPQVPNLEMWYNYTKTIWILNKQGNKAYVIARPPKGLTADEFLTNYTYTYHYTLVTGAQSKDIIGYKIPNEWVIDAVTLSPKNKYVWNVTGNALDMGFTFVGENSTIAENVGKSVVRRVSYTTVDGRVVLQDTNNSTIDFIPSSEASLLNK